MKPILKFVAAAAALTALQAHALTWSITGGAYSSQAGARHETFDNLATDPNEAVDLAITGGALFGASISGVTARPPGSVGKFLSVGTSGNQGGPIVVDLSAMPATYYGLLWGSPDTYNAIELHTAQGVSTFGGANIFGPSKANGFQGQVQGGQYVNFHADPGEYFTKVVLRSTGNAFETDNHAVVAVPEPQTYALMLLGLVAVAAAARRRQPAR